ncbi:lamin tail domain-containing protein [Rubripirellula tenax]|nr:lamin tail domain-containing protein [Rubripirellula tenax]
MQTRTKRVPRRRRVARKLIAERLEPRVVMAATPIISEFLASNSGGLDDIDGDSSDWIEIHNPTQSSVDLSGWRLTDDPLNLSEWTFPSVTLAANDFLVVFASDKDRAVSGEQLHTNFKLSSGGDYLALVQPDGTIVSEFAPQYPAQTTNVSFGVEFDVDDLVEVGDGSTTFVPANASLGDSWKTTSFDDASWTAGPTGIGFGIEQPGFDVRYVKAKSSGTFDGSISTLTDAELVLATPAYQLLDLNENTNTINFLGTGANGQFDNDNPFPNQSIGDDVNYFVIEATASIVVPSAGEWSFGVNSDDGFGLTLTGNGQTFSSSFEGTRGAKDTISTFNLPAAGRYEVRLVTFEGAGGASAEFFAAQGTHSTFNANFALVGDTASGGLTALQPYVAGQNPFVATDVSASMSGINPSAYTRVPFTVTDVTDVETLLLKMQYDDGFVAWINGVEVARRNAPTSLTFHSAATTTRDFAETVNAESILLDTTAIASLVNGNNVLAIQGLNASASNSSFLIAPELVASKLSTESPTYFATVTPGEVNQDPVSGIVERVVADVPAGFYTTAQTITLTSPTSGATIRYTTDGSEPTSSNGTVYTGPITVSATTNLRAAAFLPDYVSLPSITRTYLYLDDVLTQSNDGAAPVGWPTTWGTNFVDYGIDPDVIAFEGEQAVKDALLSLPTISLTTELANLFDEEFGIYSNAVQDGRDWERPASAEWINPDGTPGFQVNAGLRIRGGYSRGDFNPKHALKLFFRGSYGDSTLNYPVHGDAGVSEFDKLDLRTPQNYSWSSAGNATNNFVAEVLARYAQRDLGQPYTRSTWVHLYLDGQYWGIYQTQERADANYAAAYFGGNVADYDVLKPERGDYRNIATDGNFDAYTQLWEQAYARATDGVTPAFVEDAAYLQAQGKNPDGSDNPNFPVLLDVDNLIVYMMETLRGGNLDAPISNFLGNNRPNNYFAVRDRTGREGFRFFQHDAEHTMRNVNQDRNGPYNDANFEVGVDWFNPQWLHQQLMANDEYRIRFADAIQSAFFNDGPLSVSSMIARLDDEAAKITTAVIAESARWGDAKRGDNSPRTQADFLNAIADLRDNYLPARESIVLDQFRNTTLVLKDGAGDYNVVVSAPLLPSVDAPQFLANGQRQHGGEVPPASLVGFQSTGELVYYMTDGTDPRLFGGGIHPSAQVYDPQLVQETVVASGQTWRFLDDGTEPTGAWTSDDGGFNDSLWNTGNSEFGYGNSATATPISYGPDSNNKFITTYFRRSFNLDLSSGSPTGATIRVRRDDGVAIYINGVEVVRDNLPTGTLTSTTPASSVVGGTDETTWYEFPIDPSLLRDGANLIAAELHQISATSSDTTFDAELITSTSAPAPITVSGPIELIARSLAADGTWSAAEQASFFIPVAAASASNLRVTEVHYNPADEGDREFIELKNISSEPISLAGVRFTDGITFNFDDGSISQLGPGEIALVVVDQNLFEAFYGTSLPVAGQYSGSLSNGGETLTILAADDSSIQSFTYDDKGGDWHSPTDGDGPSLTVLSTSGDYDFGTNWRPSYVVGGTPGIDENDKPLASAGGPYVVASGATIQLTGSASDYDADQTLTYAWDLDYDGVTFDADVTGLTPSQTFTGSGPRTIALRVTDNGTPNESTIATASLVVTTPQVVKRSVAYANASAGYGASTPADNIVGLLPGQPATSANFTNYVNGLNRVVIDIEDSAATALTASDFTFKVGNSQDLTQWTDAPAPISIDTTVGGGTSGSTRVVISWPNQAILNQWLQVTVRASGGAGLATDDVFYLGNQVGEVTGAATGSQVRVTSTDTLVIRGNQSTAPGSAGIENPHDLNRDGRVNSLDTFIVRSSQAIQGLLMITGPQPLSVAPPQQSGLVLSAPNPAQEVIANVTPVAPTAPFTPTVPLTSTMAEATLPTAREHRRAISMGYRKVRLQLIALRRVDLRQASEVRRDVTARVQEFRQESIHSLDAVDAFFAKLTAEIDELAL